MEINKIFLQKKYHKVGLVCIIILLLIIISRFKILDIGGNKLFLFVGLNKTGYLLKPVIIKREIGTLYLKKFGKVYPTPVINGFGIKFYVWYEINVNGEEIEYDLTLFGEKIKNIKYMLLDERNFFTIFITPQYFEIFNTIDEIEGRPATFIDYDPHQRIVILFREEYKSSYRIVMTLDGEIIEKSFY